MYKNGHFKKKIVWQLHKIFFLRESDVISEQPLDMATLVIFSLPWTSLEDNTYYLNLGQIPILLGQILILLGQILFTICGKLYFFWGKF